MPNRQLRNVTITVDPGTLKKARAKAAGANMSLSRYVGEVLRERLGTDGEYEKAMRRFLASDFTIDTRKYGPPPRREEIYDRATRRAGLQADERARLRRR